MAVIIKTRDSKCWEEVKKKNPCTLWVEKKIGAAIMKNGMEVPQKIKIRATLWSTILLLDIYLEKINTVKINKNRNS